MNVRSVALASLLLAPGLAVADEWDDPKPPEKLGMRYEWFRSPELAALDAAVGTLAVDSYRGPRTRITEERPAPAPSVPSWEGDDSQFNPNGPERSRGGGGAGKLDQQSIKDAIHSHLGEVKFCFAREQAQHPELAGRVIVRFTIAEGGNVTASEVESSTVESASVDRCVAAAVRRWIFPSPKGGSMVVSWPFKVVAMR